MQINVLTVNAQQAHVDIRLPGSEGDTGPGILVFLNWENDHWELQVDEQDGSEGIRPLSRFKLQAGDAIDTLDEECRPKRARQGRRGVGIPPRTHRRGMI